jgi:hypothetical protein
MIARVRRTSRVLQQSRRTRASAGLRGGCRCHGTDAGGARGSRVAAARQIGCLQDLLQRQDRGARPRRVVLGCCRPRPRGSQTRLAPAPDGPGRDAGLCPRCRP